MSNQQLRSRVSEHSRIQSLLESIELNWRPIGQVAVMPKRFIESIDRYGQQDENRDGRGTKHEIIQEVRRTLKHLQKALKRVGSTDRAIAQLARRLLKSLQHANDFGETVVNASKFAGEVQKLGIRNAKKRVVCDPIEYECGEIPGAGKFVLRRICSVNELIKVGRKLSLCVAKSDYIGRYHHARLKNRETEYWALDLESEPIGLLNVEEDEDGRVIEEFQGAHGDEPDAIAKDGESILPWRALLRNMLSSLNADPQNLECFTSVGLFQSLATRSAQESYQSVVIGGQYYRVWRFEDEVITAAFKGRTRDLSYGQDVKWSRFVREPKSEGMFGRRKSNTEFEWELKGSHAGSLDVGDLLDLLVRSRDLYNIFVGET